MDFSVSISDKNIAEFNICARVYRNRRIGDFLKELKLIEGRNTGFPNAIKALEMNGSGSLVFDMDENRNYLSVTIPIHPYFVKKTELSEKELVYREKIIFALKEKPLSKNELAKVMGYKSISAKLTAVVDAMVAERILVKVIVGNSVKMALSDKQ